VEQRNRSALVILAHPIPGSFNHSAAEQANGTLVENGFAVQVHDLYAEGFQPLLTQEELKRRFSFDPEIQEFGRQTRNAELLVFVHPDWWGGPPAVLKGWLERVLRPGVAYDFEGPEFSKKEKVPLLTGKKVLVLCTTDAAQNELLARTWRESILAYCGITHARVEVLTDMRNSTRRQRTRWLENIPGYVKSLID